MGLFRLMALGYVCWAASVLHRICIHACMLSHTFERLCHATLPHQQHHAQDVTCCAGHADDVAVQGVTGQIAQHPDRVRGEGVTAGVRVKCV